MIRDGLYEVTDGPICAEFEVEDGRVTDCAPILRAQGISGWIRRVDTFQRILVTGARAWDDCTPAQRREFAGLVEWALVTVWQRMDVRADQVVVVNGKARKGLDRVARLTAMRLGMRVEDHQVTKAEWKRYGNAAGHRRNAVMVAYGARLCIGFPRGKSSGTRGCMKLAKAAAIPVWDLEDRCRAI